MPGNHRAQVEGYVFYDSTGNSNPIGKFSCVSLANAAEVALANAAGCQGKIGDIVVQTPVAAGLPTRPVIGVTDGSARQGQEVLVAVSGIAFIMANAAIAGDTLVYPAAAAVIGSNASPLIDNMDMLIPTDPQGSGLQYNLCLIDDPAPPASGTWSYPIGWTMEPAVAQYDVIRVRLMRWPLR